VYQVNSWRTDLAYNLWVVYTFLLGLGDPSTTLANSMMLGGTSTDGDDITKII